MQCGQQVQLLCFPGREMNAFTETWRNVKKLDWKLHLNVVLSFWIQPFVFSHICKTNQRILTLCAWKSSLVLSRFIYSTVLKFKVVHDVCLLQRTCCVHAHCYIGWCWLDSLTDFHLCATEGALWVCVISAYILLIQLVKFTKSGTF